MNFINGRPPKVPIEKRSSMTYGDKIRAKVARHPYLGAVIPERRKFRKFCPAPQQQLLSDSRKPISSLLSDMDECPACYNCIVIPTAMAEDADSTRNERLQVYLKLLDYKRSIGATQWTVLSVFTTASGAVLVFAFGRDSSLVAGISLPFAVGLYWLGFMLYRRYRAYNRRVSEYLIELEEQIGVGFQKHVNSFNQKGFSTEKILVLGGVVYSLFGLAVFVVSLLAPIHQKH